MTDSILYELAFAFKNTKLWNKMTDGDLFAVRLPDGEIGYCSVMGMAGEHYALALYPGERGIRSYFRLLELDPEDPIDWAELRATQECLMCSFENKDMLSDEEIEEVRAYATSVGKRLRGSNAFPQFTKYRIGRYPWQFETEQDTERMRVALQAAIQVSQLIRERGRGNWILPEPEVRETPPSNQKPEGSSSVQLSLFGEGTEEFSPLSEPNALPENRDHAYFMEQISAITLPLLEREGGAWAIRQISLPDVQTEWAKPKFSNGILTEYLRRAKKKGVWECGTMYASESVQLNDDDMEAPYYPMLLVSVKHANGRRLDPPIFSDTGEPGELIAEFANCLREVGCPKKILTGDDRCFTLLSDICQKIGIELDNDSPPRYLYEAMEDILEDDEDVLDMDESEKLEELCEMLMELPDEAIRNMPPYLSRDLSRLSEGGLLPEELTERLNKLRR